MDQLIALAQARLRDLADPVKAGPMAAYMKTDMPFYGVPAPIRATVARELVQRFAPPDLDAYRTTVLALWALPHREEKYLAIDVAIAHSQFIGPPALGLYERLVRDGRWWDLVDPVATRLVGGALAVEPIAVWPVMDRWIDDPDVWIRRAALLCQLGRRDQADVERLLDYCLRRAGDREFFIRKAIGWILREYAKTDPGRVRAFVDENRQRLSTLSAREASKHLAP